MECAELRLCVCVCVLFSTRLYSQIRRRCKYIPSYLILLFFFLELKNLQLQVLKPYICNLVNNLECRFQDIEVLGALGVLGPKAVTSDEMTNLPMLNTLTKKFIPGQEARVLQEWTSYRQYVLLGSFKVGQLPGLI